MKAVIQRVKNAKVIIKDGDEFSIEKGMVLILAIGENDTEKDLLAMAETVLNAKIFEGANGHFSNSLLDERFELLLISQFTLYGNIQADNTIKFIGGATNKIASKLFEFVRQEFVRQIGDKVKSGKFGAYMNVILDNDGPVTMVL